MNINRRISLLAVAAIAVTGSLAVPAGSSHDSIRESDDAMSLSMVELLGDESVSDPVTLLELVTDVTGKRQRANGSDDAGIDIAMIDSGVAPVDGLDGPSVIHGPDLSGEGQFPQVAYLDTYGHGTHMAGIMVGQRAGHEGIAPGARVVSVKVAGAEGITTVPQVVAGIDWVVEHRNTDGLNIRVLSLSLGQAGVTTHEGNLLSAAVERANDAGIFVVAAAGNRGEGQPHLDAPAIDPFVMAVGAVDSSVQPVAKWQEPTSWTARGTGNRHPDIGAPGVSIASYRVPGSTVDELAPHARYGDDLFLGSGTSQSAAVVSASAARLLGDYPDLTPSDLKATFEAGVAITSISPAPFLLFGDGVVQGGNTHVPPARARASSLRRGRPGPVAVGRAPPGRAPPGPVQPGPVQPGPVQPGPVQPGRAPPGRAQPGRAPPGRAQPGRAQPGAVTAGPEPATLNRRP